MRTLLLCFVALIFWGLSACEQCGIEREPIARISFFSPLPSFKKIRILSGLKDTLSRQGFLNTNGINAPINLNAAQTTYIFESANRTDTLTVFYDKTVFNRGTNCSYVLDIEAPFKGPLSKSTFQKVDVQYNQLYFRGGTIKGGAGDVSINIFVSKL